jgi:hypothetical protein
MAAVESGNLDITRYAHMGKQRSMILSFAADDTQLL